METFKFTKTVLDFEENQEAISAIELELGRKLIVDEEIDLEQYRGLCNGKECEDGKICVLGHCVDDDVPTELEIEP